jgi:hypothetical protein
MENTTPTSKDRHYNGQNKMDKALQTSKNRQYNGQNEMDKIPHRHLRTDNKMAKIKWTKHYTDI